MCFLIGLVSTMPRYRLRRRIRRRGARCQIHPLALRPPALHLLNRAAHLPLLNRAAQTSIATQAESAIVHAIVFLYVEEGLLYLLLLTPFKCLIMTFIFWQQRVYRGCIAMQCRFFLLISREHQTGPASCLAVIHEEFMWSLAVNV